MLSEGGRERESATFYLFIYLVCVCFCLWPVCAQFNGLFPRTLANAPTLKPTHKKSAVIHKLPQSSFVNNTPLKGDMDGFNSQRLSS